MKQTVLCIFLVSLAAHVLAARIGSVEKLPRRPGDVRSFNPFDRVQAEAYSYEEGTALELCDDTDGVIDVTSMFDGDFLSYTDADFSDGISTKIEVRVTSSFPAGHAVQMFIRLDTSTGPVIASIVVTDTSYAWDTITATLLVGPPTYFHDIYFTFATNDQTYYYWGINWFQFL